MATSTESLRYLYSNLALLPKNDREFIAIAWDRFKASLPWEEEQARIERLAEELEARMAW